MLRIGDAAKRFDISKRTLRYWEDEGILKSIRAENGYRYYDNDNSMRIKQIILLRKLKMPINDIEQIFLSNDLNAAVDILTNHLKNLKQEVFLNLSLATAVEELIKNIKFKKNLEQIFVCLEEKNTNSFPEHKHTQIMLSERNNGMFINQPGNVRIVRLPAMTVVSYRAESETPEQDCAEVMNKFVLENSLHKKSGFRHFGFNNPNPTADAPVYGYEMCVSVPENFVISAPLAKKDFTGGLYASIVASMGDIDECWQQLNDWVTNSNKYELDLSAICMEECIDFEKLASGNDNEMQLDLLMPIKEKTGGNE